MIANLSPRKDIESFLDTQVPRYLIVLNLVAAVIYFYLLAFWFPRSDSVLFWLLMGGEVFHLWQLGTFLWTIWQTEYAAPFDSSYQPAVDVFIPVVNEPVEIVRETIEAALAMHYPRHRVYLLNDGFVAKKSEWYEMELLAERMGVTCITRKTPGGAKAGNINNALRETTGDLVVVFDADHVPHADFLEKTVPYFHDAQMGFVQTPQYYKNRDKNEVTRGAWEQQALFFGAICKGKNRLNAVTMCGTNMVVRRDALESVGGMCEESIAEDFATGIFIHERGWKSLYVPEVLAEGLAPEDFLSYYKQQFRWARGGLDVIFKYKVLFRPGLSWKQRVQYLASVSHFLSGGVVLMNALIPLAFFMFGVVPFGVSTMLLAAIFLPYIFLTIYLLQRSSGFSFSFRSLAFSMAGFPIHLRALWAAFIGEKTGFSVTSKQGISGSFVYLVIPQILYIVFVIAASGYAVAREGLSPSLLSNVAWAALNSVIFMEFIAAALPQESYSYFRDLLAPRTLAHE